MAYALADRHLQYWRENRSNPTERLKINTQWNEGFENIFVFQFFGTSVSVKPKPAFFSEEELNFSEPNGVQSLQRMQKYREFFKAVIQKYNLSLDFEIAMDMHDLPIQSFLNPVFAFQKKEFSPAILVPDIDIIGSKTHGLCDKLLYDKKISKAIFVGSTTGSQHSALSVRKLENERLKNAVFFKGHPLVDFSLPNIVQCDDEAKQCILDLGIGDKRIPWKDQFGYKFIISIDGNGATCSRVLIILKSNSILLKYASLSQLFYFPLLREYQHYLPVYRPEDVAYFVNEEKNFRNEYLNIIRNAQDFYQQFLTIDALKQYTMQLLINCNQIFARHSN